jgi:DNA-binding GntR family transcriptional regulator
MTFLEGFPTVRIKKNGSKSLRENIVEALEETIYSGYFPPGFRLIESELADKLKISRTPVREALLQLESKGLVKILPNKGAVVAIRSVDEIGEIYIIFGALAGAAASLSVECIDEDGIRQMESCITKMAMNKEKMDRKEWFVLNNEFHSLFLKPCRKEFLLGLIKNYTKQVGRYWYLLLSHPSNVESFSDHHRSIFEAFKSRDSKLARDAVENHIRSFGEIVVESLRSISSLQFDYPNQLGGGKLSSYWAGDQY